MNLCNIRRAAACPQWHTYLCQLAPDSQDEIYQRLMTLDKTTCGLACTISPDTPTMDIIADVGVTEADLGHTRSAILPGIWPRESGRLPKTGPKGSSADLEVSNCNSNEWNEVVFVSQTQIIEQLATETLTQRRNKIALLLGKTASEPRKTKVLEFTENNCLWRTKQECNFCQKKPFLGVLAQERANSLKNQFYGRAQNANFAQKPFLGNFPPLLCGNLGILCGNLPCCAGNCAGIFWKTLQWLIFCVFGLTSDFCVFFRQFSEFLKELWQFFVRSGGLGSFANLSVFRRFCKLRLAASAFFMVRSFFGVDKVEFRVVSLILVS